MENSSTKNTLIILGVAALGTLAEVGIYFGGRTSRLSQANLHPKSGPDKPESRGSSQL